MKILILEDCPERTKQFRSKLIGHEVTFTDQAAICIEYLKNDTFDILCLDHDLGGQAFVPSGPGTGYEVASWLSDNLDRKPKQVLVHSLNPVGAARICQALPDAVRVPFVWMSVLK